ncbi:tumor necrosis factor receptor superfamily member 14 isoform X3 [Sebastes umbrosus]|uniref:tumor necrosis factor receptor superfamily member 14 isoform X3 n=1 Tax=Sebastes umbrosus TaxID=72105 RepID=UPI00189DAAB7|nr:tumor necrosis factor receptor superfamily member 14 isoform X3 [Sebastes umbrosus]
MGVVQCFVIVSMLSAKLVLTSPLADEFYPMGSSECPMCPAGKYEESCAECKSCPAGYYTTELNREDSCHPCYGDCKPHLHLKVVQSCTSTSDLKCVCEDGFRCTDVVPLSTNCRYCVKIQRTTTTEAAAVTSGEDKHMLSSASSGHSSTSVKPCKFPKCGPPSVPPARNDTHSKGDHTSSQLAAVLCPVVVVGCVALVILFCFWRSPGDETCFKQGPVHVHNPGTVIFSLLSQFTGQVGPTIECGKTTERVNSEEEDERDCPVFHPTSSPTSSPSIHLSEEERSGEIDSIFFPSQEQGKDCHVSKEEAL